MTASPLTSPTTRLAALRRPSGAFAMLALDQREAMRAMFTERDGVPASDERLTAFKVEIARALSPYASGILVDRQFAWDAVLAADAVAPSCALIASGDHFEPAHGELVGAVTIDRLMVPEVVRDQGAVAMKLLVLWREDEPAAGRVALVEEFVERCHRAGLAAIIEPVARPRTDGVPSDLEAGVLAAAAELGGLGADLYKAEVPFKAAASDAQVRAACARITASVASPWVVLSSGVPDHEFPRAVRLAVAEGASGFLAGRAVWRACVDAPDPVAALRTDAVDRLERLCEVVDAGVTA